MQCKDCGEGLWTNNEIETETCEMCYEEYMQQKLDELSHPEEYEFYHRRAI